MRKLLALSILALAASPLTAIAAPIGGAHALPNQATAFGTQQDVTPTPVREGSSQRRNHGVRGASLDGSAVQDAPIVLVREATSGGGRQRRNRGVRGVSLDNTVIQDAPIVLVREATSGGGRQRRNHGVRGVSLDNTVIQDAPIVLVREGSSGGGRQRRNHGVTGA